VVCIFSYPTQIPLRVRIMVYLNAEPSVGLSAFEDAINEMLTLVSLDDPRFS
jgi:hypothetical protein